MVLVYLWIILTTDVNECWNIDSCNATTEDCSNTIGAFNCSCKEGFNRTNDICEGKAITPLRDVCVISKCDIISHGFIVNKDLSSYHAYCTECLTDSEK